MSQYVSEVDDKNFEQEVLKADKPVLVDFWAEWCGPCLALAPTVETVAKSYDGRAKFVKLNVDFSNETAMRYGIRGIPTLIVFHKGSEAGRVVGMTSKDNIARLIDNALGA